MATGLRVRTRDLEEYERCPRSYRLRQEGVRGTLLPSRALDRWQVVMDAIVTAHRSSADSADGPAFEDLAAAFESQTSRAGGTFHPYNAEERAELLASLENYSIVASDLGGRFAEPDDPFIERHSTRSGITLSGREDLLFDHGSVLEARRITTSRYRTGITDDEFAGEFATQVRGLLVAGAHRGVTVQISEVNLFDATVRIAEHGPENEATAGEAVSRFAALVSGDSEKPPRPNHLCGTCPHMPTCPAIPSTPIEGAR